MRQTSLLTILAASLALAGCAIIVSPNEGDVQVRHLFSKDSVQGNGMPTVERRAVSSVADIDVSGPITMDVKVGQSASLQVEADSNLLPMVRTEIAGGALRVWVDGSVRTDNPIRVSYTAPQVSQLRANGSGRLLVTDLNGGPLTLVKTGSGESQLSGRVGNFNVHVTGSGTVNATALQSGNTNATLTGSGRLTLGQVNAGLVNVKVYGSGELQASGAAAQLNAQVTGSGDANLRGLSSQRAELSTGGSGDITAQVTQSLVAQTSGSGSITVYGNPTQRNITGNKVHVVN